MTSETLHQFDYYVAFAFGLLCLACLFAEMPYLWVVATMAFGWRGYVAFLNLKTISKHGWFICGKNINETLEGKRLFGYVLHQPWHATAWCFVATAMITGNLAWLLGWTLAALPVCTSLYSMSYYQVAMANVEE